jgi:hypothetical protein
MCALLNVRLVDGDGGAFVPFGDDLEEQLGAARVGLDVAQFAWGRAGQGGRSGRPCGTGRGHRRLRAMLRASFDHRGNGRMYLVPARANTQPALVGYLGYLGDHAGAPTAPAGLFVLTMAGPKIHAVTSFHLDELYLRFGLPDHCPPGRAARCAQCVRAGLFGTLRLVIPNGPGEPPGRRPGSHPDRRLEQDWADTPRYAGTAEPRDIVTISLVLLYERGGGAYFWATLHRDSAGGDRGAPGQQGPGREILTVDGPSSS